MATKKKKKTTHHTILTGPNREALFDSLRLGLQHPGVHTVTFALYDTDGDDPSLLQSRRVTVQILGIATTSVNSTFYFTGQTESRDFISGVLDTTLRKGHCKIHADDPRRVFARMCKPRKPCQPGYRRMLITEVTVDRDFYTIHFGLISIVRTKSWFEQFNVNVNQLAEGMECMIKGTRGNSDEDIVRINSIEDFILVT